MSEPVDVARGARPHFVWSLIAGFLLLPYAWALSWMGLLVLPTTWLGGEHAWLLRTASLVVALVPWLASTLALGRWSRALARNLSLGALVLGLPLLPVFAVILHTSFGTPVLAPEDCAGAAAVTPLRCQGRDHSFLQGRERYIRVEGRAAGPLCRTLRDDDGRQATAGGCSIEQPTRWSAARCERFGLRTDWRCYECQEQRSTGDFYYYVHAFDARCADAIALLSINVIPERIGDAVDGVAPVIDELEPER